ncbi:carbohydrate-binding family 9-like protein [Adhaeribacter swui]|uniref:Carbohydrate-binding family 9-like protein n=1 Tax=Adhaeribacter swui TaxID=2086471 RepID=A0A7G7GDZ4_9BACT|nr:carbohydrate-binding family 9-like protein [Adhaeribacter swui]QNF35378.1 carbohydrate-binding family 9-like protein [Adhaeribacter swui]
MLHKSLLSLFAFLLLIGNSVSAQKADSSQLIIKKTPDFTVTGEGKSPNWAKTKWVSMPVQETAGEKLNTKAKILYSETGIYFLFHCEDQKLTATFEEDGKPLYKEDVVEVFLWPDPAIPAYLEYELSPLNYELVLMIINKDGKFSGWRPSSYTGKRQIQHATSVQGGEKKSQAAIKSWMGEIFIPFSLLQPMVLGAPAPGSKWRANFYRIDHDKGYTTGSWQKTTPNKPANFHEFNKFGTFVFE